MAGGAAEDSVRMGCLVTRAGAGMLGPQNQEEGIPGRGGSQDQSPGAQSCGVPKQPAAEYSWRPRERKQSTVGSASGVSPLEGPDALTVGA